MAQFTEQLDKIRAVIHKNEVVKKYADMIEEKTKVPQLLSLDEIVIWIISKLFPVLLKKYENMNLLRS